MALLVVALSIVPLIFFSTFLVRRVVAAERAANERLLVQGARLQADAIERELSASVRALSALAESPTLTAGNVAAFHDEAARVAATQESWYFIQLSAPSGDTLVNTREPAGAALRPAVDTDSLRQVLRTRAPAIGTLTRGPRGTLAFAIRVPVIRAGAVRYVLSAIVRPETLTAILVHEFHPHEEWTRTLVDPAGTIVARTRSPEQFVGQATSAEFRAATAGPADGVLPHTSLDGEPVYVAYSHGPQWGWLTSTVVPKRILDAPVRRSQFALAAMSALTVVFGIGMAWLLASTVSRDLRQATASAGRLARGEAPASGTSRVEEIAELDEALERSAQLLAERRRERDQHLEQANEARAAAEASARAKDEFLAMLGHELRNPLSPIVTALHLLRLRRADGEREYAVIERQVRHLTRLVDDLLDVSRITRGKLELKRQPLEIHQVVEQALEMSGPLFEERQQRVSVDVPASGCGVVADPARLAQVVANLLVNAAKYTPAGGAIHIAAAVEDGEVALRVTDTGRGLSPELLPRVFDSFVQGPRAIDRQEGGLGLGLTLVRQLVLLHGGSVAAESPGVGQGSTFTIRLPRAAVAEIPAIVAAPAASPAPRRRVMVVDDNPDALETLAALIRAWGHDVLAVGDTAGALEQAPAFGPDVALLDIGLPVMNGYELAAELRRRLDARPPAFVAVTGYGQHHDQARSAAEGFAAHLVKPIDAEELFRALAGAPESA
jgi:signal transduction histidine kinase